MSRSNNTMKILVVSKPVTRFTEHELDPYFKMAKMGFQVHFLYRGDSLEATDNMVLHKCKGESTLKRVLDIIKREKIDFIMNSTSNVEILLLVLLSSKLTSAIPVLRITSNTPETAVHQERNKLNKVIKRIIYPTVWRISMLNAEGVICVSSYLKDLVVSYGAKNVLVASQGVDLDNFKPKEVAKEYDLLFVGRISKEKNLTMLLDAFKELKKDYRDLKLCVVGEGPEKDELKKKYGEKDIYFEGYVNHSNLQDYYNKSKILVLTSLSEGFPTVIMEAMACGLPVVATNVGGVPEIIAHGKTGFLVDPNDLRDLKERIKSLLINEDIRRDMGNKALKCIKNHHSLSVVSKKYDEFLSDLNESKSK